MKNKLLVSLFISGLLFAACNDKKDNDVDDMTAVDTTVYPVDNTAVERDTLTPDIDVEAPVTVTVQGRVAKITNGKDGYTVLIKEDSGKEYYATISRVNLADPKQYKEVKEGDRITVKGESFKLDEKLHIKVHELK